MTLVDRARASFESQFGQAPARTFQAPGRVNLIGEHTDYNDGFVLPCAITYGTVIAARSRQDKVLNVFAADYGALDAFSLTDPIRHNKETLWTNYIRGVVREFQAAGHEIEGADLVVAGDVPQGAGLSSSASLEVALGTALKGLNALETTPTEIAKLGQAAENNFVGTNCGIMDQLISAKGRVDHALLIDCRTLETRPVTLPEGQSIVIINSNVKRGLVESEYNDRRKQCEEAARLLGVKALRDIGEESFKANEDKLPDLIARRARHVVTENARTLAAAKAMEEDNINTLGKLMAASHISMRDDFEITVPPIDLIVDLVNELGEGLCGVRMTGGGFGGCVVALMSSDLIEPLQGILDSHYEKETGLKASIYTSLPARGAGEVF